MNLPDGTVSERLRYLADWIDEQPQAPETMAIVLIWVMKDKIPARGFIPTDLNLAGMVPAFFQTLLQRVIGVFETAPIDKGKMN